MCHASQKKQGFPRVASNGEHKPYDWLTNLGTSLYLPVLNNLGSVCMP